MIRRWSDLLPTAFSVRRAAWRGSGRRWRVGFDRRLRFLPPVAIVAEPDLDTLFLELLGGAPQAATSAGVGHLCFSWLWHGGNPPLHVYLSAPSCASKGLGHHQAPG